MVKLIAEIGINHQGKFSKIKKLIDGTCEAKVNFIKFQYRRNAKSFFTNTLEMGSTLIKDELKNLFISDKDYIKAFQYAKKLKLKIGVSFFRTEDIKYLTKKFKFDFIKIPSAEALNFELIKTAMKNSKQIMLSLGGANWNDINLLKKKIKFRKNDVIFYCISNYPTAIDAVNFNHLKSLKKLFSCHIGYSSHDRYWEVSLGSISVGVDFIERHICLKKDQPGLDISSSSSIQEFKRLNEILTEQQWYKNVKVSDKVANQGEIQNLKDLGSGYYYKSNYKKGDIITSNELKIMSPCRGVKAGTFNNSGKKLKRDVIEGFPLLIEDFNSEKHKKNLSKEIYKLSNFNIGLPIRFSDMYLIMKQFNLPFFEFHMSFEDVFLTKNLKRNFWEQLKNSNAGYSVHLPDYISSTKLIDPLANKNSVTYTKSLKIINQCMIFAQEIEDKTSKSCPIVGSFSNLHVSKESTYYRLVELIEKLSKNEGGIIPQFLPKRAWYFGGAVELDLFCSVIDKKYYANFPFGICLDTAHLIMACNSVKGNLKSWFRNLLQYASHLHLADATGVDAEGINFGEGELDLKLLKSNKNNIRYIIEQWEGHLYNFKGFKNAITYLVKEL